MTEWFSHLGMAFGIIFGGVFILLGLLLFAVGWSTLRQRLGQPGWVRVPAEILSGTIEIRTLDDATYYLPRIEFRFPTRHGEATGRKVSLAEKMYTNQAKARRILDKYPIGTHATILYPEENPEDAVLQPGGAAGGIFVLVLGGAMVAGPLLAANAAGLPAKEVGTGIVAVMVFLWGWLTLWGSRKRRVRRNGLLPPRGCGTDADVERLVRQGERLLAIHLYREIHGGGLKAARQAVDDMMSGTSG